MSINIILYLIEIAIIVVALIVGTIIFAKKDKKNYTKFFIIAMVTFVLVFLITFFVEKPDMQVNTVEVIEAKSNHKLEKVNTVYHFQNVTDNVNIVGDIDYDKIGDYKVTYEIDTMTGKYSKEVTVKVVDTTPPVITLEGKDSYRQSYSTEYEEPGYTAVDNYDGDVTKKVKTEKIEIDDDHFNIKYTVSDKAKNTSEKIRKVTIIDDVPPTITLNGFHNKTVYLDNNYEEDGAKAEDEKDGDLTDKIQITGEVDTSKEGDYEITYTVSDSKGNKATETRKVTVKDASKVQSNSVIYLTFDDGPSDDTGYLLDVLKKYNVKATFFVTGRGDDGIIKRAYDEGHQIALHTYSHDYSYVYSSIDNYFTDLNKIKERVKNITGYESNLIRFPGGSSNTVSRSYDGGTHIMSYLTKEVERRGYHYFDWNVSSGDAGGTTTAQGVYENVVNSLKPNGSSIVLQHDNKSFSIKAVKDIIQYGYDNGYTFDVLTENSPGAHHGVNN